MNLIRHQFPQYSDNFPMMYRPSLLASALFEAKNITQAPEAIAYLAAISSVSVALQGQVNVKLPIGKVCPASIWVLIVSGSGERKSTVESAFTKGIKLFKKDSVKNHQKDLAEYKLKLEIHKNKEALIKASINLDNEKKRNKVVDELIAHDESKPVKPKMPILIFENCTSEALLAALSEDIPNASLASSEGGVVLNSRGMANTAPFNTLWSGDELNVSTKSDGSIIVTEARLTMNIMVQPSALDRFLNKTKDDVRGNGFLSRFLVCAPASNCGSRFANGFEHSSDNLKKFNDRVYELLTEAGELDDYTNRKTISFSDEAKSAWLDVYNDIEYKMGPNGIYQHARDHASKLPENIARLSALIHCFDYSTDEDISVDTLVEAINLVGYFSGQFMAVFSAPPKYVVDANNLMQWLGPYFNSGVRYIKKNKILQNGPSGTRKARDLEEALNYLKSTHSLIEIISNKTRVIDLWPRNQLDEIKLKQDLSLDVVL